jgi:pyruvate dehydrogenase E2 component (dihydrolipoamide acetyltransferase)
MISEVVMPQMGADMEEGTIVRWLKNEGDEVDRGEIIAEIETDKADVEIEAFESGVFRKVLVPEGETVSVGTVIAVVASQDEDISKYEGASAPAKPVEAKAKAKPKEEAAPAEEAAEEEKPAKVMAEAKPRAKEAAPEAAEEERPAAATKPAPSTDGRVRASPVARKLAEEKGIDLTRVAGTGPDGRIVKRDIEAAVEQGEAAPAGAPVRAAEGVETVPMSRMRQTIARRMGQSKREAPHYYITTDIDMTEAEKLRHQLNDAFHRELHVSVNDLIVKASAMALERHPMFNTWFVDGEIRRHQAINVCIAIALDDGLIAPAILDCGNKSLAQIAQDSRSLAERAKSGALKPDEYSGGTFTVSNLGMFEVETLVAIIQPPQTAILGVGAVRAAPVVHDDGEVAVAQLMKTALSADHRVTDGAQGAQFLNEIRRLLENPAALLLSP